MAVDRVLFLRMGLGDAVNGRALAEFADGDATRNRVSVLFFEGLSFSSASESSSTMFLFRRFAGGAIANAAIARVEPFC